jgi:hypothetical protein
VAATLIYKRPNITRYDRASGGSFESRDDAKPSIDVDAMKRATTKDAEIFLKLQDTLDTPQMREAFLWFEKEFSAKDYEEFKSKYPMGSEGHMHLSHVLGSLEIPAVLISQGLLNENLYFDASGIEFIWPKVEHIIPELQKEAGPALWENAVWLAARQKQWKKDVWKPGLAWKLKPQKSGTTTSRKGR